MRLLTEDEITRRLTQFYRRHGDKETRKELLDRKIANHIRNLMKGGSPYHGPASKESAQLDRETRKSGREVSAAKKFLKPNDKRFQEIYSRHKSNLVAKREARKRFDKEIDASNEKMRRSIKWGAVREYLRDPKAKDYPRNEGRATNINQWFGRRK